MLLEKESFADFVKQGVTNDCLYLHECSPAVQKLFNQAQIESDPALFNVLIQLANERILSYPYSLVPLHLRRLYTDATLMQAACSLECVHQDAQANLHLIKMLDTAIIVAGTPGEGRAEWTLRMISHLQDRLSTSTLTNSLEGHRFATSTQLNPKVLRPIPCYSIQTAPSMEEYLYSAHKTPFIVKGGVKHWPAFSQWPSIEYLAQAAGPGRVVPVEVGGAYTQQNWSQAIMPLSEFLSCLSSESAHPKDMLYLAQYDVMRQIPELQRDILAPDYVHMSPGTVDGCSEYEPPIHSDRGYLTNIWIGPAGTNSPAHTDPYLNAYAQVIGRKYIWIAPPSAADGMYSFSDSHLNDNSDEEGSEQGQDTNNAAETYMSNTSRLDVIDCSLYPTAHSHRKYPLFYERALPQAMQAVLEPGDLFLMPVKWWHSLKSLDASCSVSMWF